MISRIHEIQKSVLQGHWFAIKRNFNRSRGSWLCLRRGNDMKYFSSEHHGMRRWEEEGFTPIDHVGYWVKLRSDQVFDGPVFLPEKGRNMEFWRKNINRKACFQYIGCRGMNFEDENRTKSWSKLIERKMIRNGWILDGLKSLWWLQNFDWWVELN